MEYETNDIDMIGDDNRRADLHKECMERLHKAKEFWDHPHFVAECDRKFAQGEGQWDPETEAARIRAHRDCKVYNIIPGFIRPMVNQIKQNPPAITIYPISEDADEQSANILSGVIRHIEYSSNAQRIYTIALESVAKSGLGAWRIIPKTVYKKVSRFVDTPVPTYDVYGNQTVRFVPTKTMSIEEDIDISIELIKDTSNLYFDPYSKSIDFSDAKWVIFKNVISEDEYASQYPEGKATFSNGCTEIYEYWSINESGLVDLIVFDTIDILSEQNLELTLLPFVLITGTEIENGGQTEFQSLTSEVKAPQMEINWLKSEAIASVSQAPKSSWIADDDAIKDPDAWAEAADNPDVVLFKKPGSTVIPITPPGAPDGYMALSNANVDMARQITGIYPDNSQAALSNVSGKAIAYQQAGSSIQTYHFVDALNSGIKRTGEILIDNVTVYYNNDDIRTTMGIDNTFSKVSIGPNNIPNQKNLDLTFSKYGVIVQAGPTYTSQKERFMEVLMEFSKGHPDMLPIIADIVVRNSNLPDANKLADRFRVMLPQPVQEIIASQNGSAENPSETIGTQLMQIQRLGAQLQQLQQQNAQLQAALQEANSKTQIEMAKLQAAEQRQNADIHAKMAMQEAQFNQDDDIAQLKATVQMLVAKMNGNAQADVANINSMNRTSEYFERMLK